MGSSELIALLCQFFHLPSCQWKVFRHFIIYVNFIFILSFLCGDFRISLRSIAFVINQSQRVVDEEIGGRWETERERESLGGGSSPKCSQLHSQPK